MNQLVCSSCYQITLNQMDATKKFPFSGCEINTTNDCLNPNDDLFCRLKIYRCTTNFLYFLNFLETLVVYLML